MLQERQVYIQTEVFEEWVHAQSASCTCYTKASCATGQDMAPCSYVAPVCLSLLTISRQKT